MAFEHVYEAGDEYPVAILVNTLNPKEIAEEYLKPFDIPQGDVKVYRVELDGSKNKVAKIRDYLESKLFAQLQQAKTEYILCTDSTYFKILTGADKVTTSLGYVLPCKAEEYSWKVIYIPNYRMIFYDPLRTRTQIAQSITAMLQHIQGEYEAPGSNIIESAQYPKTDKEIEKALNALLEMQRPLTIDVETFSLRHTKAGIGTISFAWSKHEGIAFPVDYVELTPEEITENGGVLFGKRVTNPHRRNLLRDFFKKLSQKKIFHNISYDACVLIYELFMTDLLDRKGLLEGMGIILDSWDCTKIITYLATNSCSGNKLDLKSNTQEFSGNYAVDEIHDITRVPLAKLLRYNLIDAMATWYLLEKNYNKMVESAQLGLYEDLFKKAILDIIEMQLTGLPLDQVQVARVKRVLQTISKQALSKIYSTKVVHLFTDELRVKHVKERNETLKKKRIKLNDPETQAIEYKPNSPLQTQDLLYRMLGLPVISLTDNKNPAVDAETLEKLILHTQDPDVQTYLQAMVDYAAVDKQLSTFIPAFEEAIEGPDGWHYLLGSYIIGGTLSGRMSSRDPNMQNLPANVEMDISAEILKIYPWLDKFISKGKLHLGKLMKSCFAAPPGWLLVGLDFQSLEDRISALTTKDPNKLAVYQGHRVFEITINGTCHHVREDTIIVFDGQRMTAQEFYDTRSPV